LRRMRRHLAGEATAIFPRNGAAIGGAQDHCHETANLPSLTWGAASAIS
jgi:hypothetical protein